MAQKFDCAGLGKLAPHLDLMHMFIRSKYWLELLRNRGDVWRVSQASCLSLYQGCTQTHRMEGCVCVMVGTALYGKLGSEAPVTCVAEGWFGLGDERVGIACLFKDMASRFPKSKWELGGRAIGSFRTNSYHLDCCRRTYIFPSLQSLDW